MSRDSSILTRYTEGSYWNQHSNWHLEDSPGKAEDLLPGLLAVVDRMSGNTLKLADVGAGVGGVLNEVTALLRTNRPEIEIEATAIEVSAAAVEEARRRFPEIKSACKLLEAGDGPFTAVMLVDVLEHLENPWELLRTAAQVSEFLVVRQPLLEGFGMFRHKGYKNQRQKWGHIGYFNYHSFCDMADVTGWKPLHIELVAPWELKTTKARAPSYLNRFITRTNRLLASHFISGFYLNGAFERSESVTPATPVSEPSGSG